MGYGTLEHSGNTHEGSGTSRQRFILRKIVEEMKEALNIESYIDYSSYPRFSKLHKNKINPFGYDGKREMTTRPQSFYRMNALRHKLLRIQQELRFVKNHIHKYRELTPREKEIIQLLAKGYNNPEIAERLFISRYTVEQHHKHINQKLAIKSLPHLLKYAYAFNLI